MGLEDDIAKCISDNGLKNPALIVNGSYLTQAGRRVYAAPVRNGIRYFTRVYNRNLHSSEVEDCGYLTPRIRDIVKGDTLFGVQFEGMNNSMTLRADSTYNIVFIESALYDVGRRLQNGFKPGMTFTLHGRMSTADEARAVQSVFLEHALNDYGELVYSQGSNRFIKSLLRKNSLLGIRPTSFIPVFISYKKLYSPLDSDVLRVEDTLMHKMAVEKGRFVENGDVSAYFMTHREICEAFGMSRFARFTPYIWYKIYVGLLQPSNANFPNKVSRIVRWSGEVDPPAGMKSFYTEAEFAKVVQGNSELLPEELALYRRVDSLEEFIREQFNTIRNVGPHYLDDKDFMRIGNLYNLYAEAELRF